jgi:hypothetical protein
MDKAPLTPDAVISPLLQPCGAIEDSHRSLVEVSNLLQFADHGNTRGTTNKVSG